MTTQDQTTVDETTFEYASQAKGLGDIVAYINAFRTTQTGSSVSVSGSRSIQTREKEDYSNEGGRYAN